MYDLLAKSYVTHNASDSFHLCNMHYKKVLVKLSFVFYTK